MSSSLTSTKENDAKNVVLDVRNLSVKFMMDTGTVLAVNDASFHIRAGETVCLVGETGAGKESEKKRRKREEEEKIKGNQGEGEVGK